MQRKNGSKDARYATIGHEGEKRAMRCGCASAVTGPEGQGWQRLIEVQQKSDARVTDVPMCSMGFYVGGREEPMCSLETAAHRHISAIGLISLLHIGISVPNECEICCISMFLYQRGETPANMGGRGFEPRLTKCGPLPKMKKPLYRGIHAKWWTVGDSGFAYAKPTPPSQARSGETLLRRHRRLSLTRFHLIGSSPRLNVAEDLPKMKKPLYRGSYSKWWTVGDSNPGPWD